MLAEEEDGDEELVVGVLLLLEAVAFVASHEVAHLPAVVADGLDHLFGFGDGDAWIVLALDDEERLVDPAGLCGGRDLLEELAHLLVTLVAVFDASQVAPVVLGVLEEGEEVRDADDV